MLSIMIKYLLRFILLFVISVLLHSLSLSLLLFCHAAPTVIPCSMGALDLQNVFSPEEIHISNLNGCKVTVRNANCASLQFIDTATATSPSTSIFIDNLQCNSNTTCVSFLGKISASGSQVILRNIRNINPSPSVLLSFPQDVSSLSYFEIFNCQQTLSQTPSADSVTLASLTSLTSVAKVNVSGNSIQVAFGHSDPVVNIFTIGGAVGAASTNNKEIYLTNNWILISADFDDININIGRPSAGFTIFAVGNPSIQGSDLIQVTNNSIQITSSIFHFNSPPTTTNTEKSLVFKVVQFQQIISSTINCTSNFIGSSTAPLSRSSNGYVIMILIIHQGIDLMSSQKITMSNNKIAFTKGISSLPPAAYATSASVVSSILRISFATMYAASQSIYTITLQKNAMVFNKVAAIGDVAITIFFSEITLGTVKNIVSTNDTLSVTSAGGSSVEIYSILYFRFRVEALQSVEMKNASISYQSVPSMMTNLSNSLNVALVWFLDRCSTPGNPLSGDISDSKIVVPFAAVRNGGLSGVVFNGVASEINEFVVQNIAIEGNIFTGASFFAQIFTTETVIVSPAYLEVSYCNITTQIIPPSSPLLSPILLQRQTLNSINLNTTSVQQQMLSLSAVFAQPKNFINWIIVRFCISRFLNSAADKNNNNNNNNNNNGALLSYIVYVIGGISSPNSFIITDNELRAEIGSTLQETVVNTMMVDGGNAVSGSYDAPVYFFVARNNISVSGFSVASETVLFGHVALFQPAIFITDSEIRDNFLTVVFPLESIKACTGSPTVANIYVVRGLVLTSPLKIQQNVLNAAVGTSGKVTVVCASFIALSTSSIIVFNQSLSSSSEVAQIKIFNEQVKCTMYAYGTTSGSYTAAIASLLNLRIISDTNSFVPLSKRNQEGFILQNNTLAVESISSSLPPIDAQNQIVALGIEFATTSQNLVRSLPILDVTNNTIILVGKTESYGAFAVRMVSFQEHFLNFTNFTTVAFNRILAAQSPETLKYNVGFLISMVVTYGYTPVFRSLDIRSNVIEFRRDVLFDANAGSPGVSEFENSVSIFFIADFNQNPKVVKFSIENNTIALAGPVMVKNSLRVYIFTFASKFLINNSNNNNNDSPSSIRLVNNSIKTNRFSMTSSASNINIQILFVSPASPSFVLSHQLLLSNNIIDAAASQQISGTGAVLINIALVAAQQQKVPQIVAESNVVRLPLLLLASPPTSQSTSQIRANVVEWYTFFNRATGVSRTSCFNEFRTTNNVIEYSSMSATLVEIYILFFSTIPSETPFIPRPMKLETATLTPNGTIINFVASENRISLSSAAGTSITLSGTAVRIRVINSPVIFFVFATISRNYLSLQNALFVSVSTVELVFVGWSRCVGNCEISNNTFNVSSSTVSLSTTSTLSSHFTVLLLNTETSMIDPKSLAVVSGNNNNNNNYNSYYLIADNSVNLVDLQLFVGSPPLAILYVGIAIFGQRLPLTAVPTRSQQQLSSISSSPIKIDFLRNNHKFKFLTQPSQIGKVLISRLDNKLLFFNNEDPEAIQNAMNVTKSTDALLMPPVILNFSGNVPHTSSLKTNLITASSIVDDRLKQLQTFDFSLLKKRLPISFFFLEKNGMEKKLQVSGNGRIFSFEDSLTRDFPSQVISYFLQNTHWTFGCNQWSSNVQKRFQRQALQLVKYGRVILNCSEFEQLSWSNSLSESKSEEFVSPTKQKLSKTNANFSDSRSRQTPSISESPTPDDSSSFTPFNGSSDTKSLEETSSKTPPVVSVSSLASSMLPSPVMDTVALLSIAALDPASMAWLNRMRMLATPCGESEPYLPPLGVDSNPLGFKLSGDKVALANSMALKNGKNSSGSNHYYYYYLSNVEKEIDNTETYRGALAGNSLLIFGILFLHAFVGAPLVFRARNLEHEKKKKEWHKSEKKQNESERKSKSQSKSQRKEQDKEKQSNKKKSLPRVVVPPKFSSLAEAAASIKCPGLAIIPYRILLVPTVFSIGVVFSLVFLYDNSAAIEKRKNFNPFEKSSEPLPRVYAPLAVIEMVALVFSVLLFVAVPVFAMPVLSWIYNRKEPAAESLLSRSEFFKMASQKGQRFGNRVPSLTEPLARLFCPSRIWDPSRRMVQHFGTIFKNTHLVWFPALDMLADTAIALANGIATMSPSRSSCEAVRYISLILCLTHFVGVTRFRPFLSNFQLTFGPILSFMSLVVSAIALVAFYVPSMSSSAAQNFMSFAAALALISSVESILKTATNAYVSTVVEKYYLQKNPARKLKHSRVQDGGEKNNNNYYYELVLDDVEQEEQEELKSIYRFVEPAARIITTLQQPPPPTTTTTNFTSSTSPTLKIMSQKSQFPVLNLNNTNNTDHELQEKLLTRTFETEEQSEFDADQEEQGTPINIEDLVDGDGDEEEQYDNNQQGLEQEEQDLGESLNGEEMSQQDLRRLLNF